MAAYIEIRSEHVVWSRQKLDSLCLRQIGEFTRENVARFLDACMHGPFDFARNPFADLCVYGWKDFHAVCDDIEIPWTR